MENLFASEIEIKRLILYRLVCHLEATSGKSVMEHPETQKMLEHIKTGHIL